MGSNLHVPLPCLHLGQSLNGRTPFGLYEHSQNKPMKHHTGDAFSHGSHNDCILNWPKASPPPVTTFLSLLIHAKSPLVEFGCSLAPLRSDGTVSGACLQKSLKNGSTPTPEVLQHTQGLCLAFGPSWEQGASVPPLIISSKQLMSG